MSAGVALQSSEVAGTTSGETSILTVSKHHLVLTILRPSTDGEGTDRIAGLTLTWNPENSGPGDVTDFDFEPEWTDYFPDKMG
jgi:hypothetical protein